MKVQRMTRRLETCQGRRQRYSLYLVSNAPGNKGIANRECLQDFSRYLINIRLNCAGIALPCRKQPQPFGRCRPFFPRPSPRSRIQNALEGNIANMHLHCRSVGRYYVETWVIKYVCNNEGDSMRRYVSVLLECFA